MPSLSGLQTRALLTSLIFMSISSTPQFPQGPFGYLQKSIRGYNKVPVSFRNHGGGTANSKLPDVLISSINSMFRQNDPNDSDTLNDSSIVSESSFEVLQNTTEYEEGTVAISTRPAVESVSNLINGIEASDMNIEKHHNIANYKIKNEIKSSPIIHYSSDLFPLENKREMAEHRVINTNRNSMLNFFKSPGAYLSKFFTSTPQLASPTYQSNLQSPTLIEHDNGAEISLSNYKQNQNDDLISPSLSDNIEIDLQYRNAVPDSLESNAVEPDFVYKSTPEFNLQAIKERLKLNTDAITSTEQSFYESTSVFNGDDQYITTGRPEDSETLPQANDFYTVVYKPTVLFNATAVKEKNKYNSNIVPNIVNASSMSLVNISDHDEVTTNSAVQDKYGIVYKSTTEFDPAALKEKIKKLNRSTTMSESADTTTLPNSINDTDETTFYLKYKTTTEFSAAGLKEKYKFNSTDESSDSHETEEITIPTTEISDYLDTNEIQIVTTEVSNTDSSIDETNEQTKTTVSPTDSGNEISSTVESSSNQESSIEIMSTIPFFSSTELELTGATQSSTSQQDVLTTDDSYLNQMNIKPTTEVDPFEIVTINLFEKTSEESSSTTDETTFSPISDLSSVDYLESTTDYPDSKTATSATGTPMLTSMATSFEMLTLNPTTEFDTNEMYTTNLYEETSEQSGSTENETTFRPISDSSTAEYLESTTSFQDLQTEKNLQTISATGTTVPTPLLTTFEIPTESISHTTSPSQTTSVETNDSTEVFELAIELLTTQTIHDQDFSTTEIANIEEDEFNADKSSVESTVTGESVVLETTLNPLLFKHKSTTELSLLKLKEKYQQNLTPELELTTFVADDKEHTTLGSIALQTETTVAPEEIENFENSIVSENNTQSTDAGSIDTNDDFDVFYKTTTEMSAETLTEKYTSTQTVTDVAVQMTTDTQFNQLVSETSEHESDSSSTDHMMDYLTSTELSDIQPVTSEPRVTTDHSINTQTSSEISSDLSTDTVETTETNSFQDMSTLQSEIVSPESTTAFETNETIEGQTSSNENIYTTNFDQKLLVETTSDVPSTDASTITESSFDLTSQTMPYSLSNSIIYKSTTEFNVNDVKERFKSSTSSMNNIEDNTEIKTPMSLLSTHVTKEKQSSATESSIEESTFSSNTEQTTYTTNKEETSQSKKYSIKYKATTEFSVEKLKEKFQNNLQKENKTSDEQTETSDDKPTTGSPPLNPSIFYQTLMHSGNNTSPNIENLQHQMIQESVSQLLAGFGNFISESPNDGDVNNEIKYEPISEHYSLNESPNILKSQEILPYNAVGYEDPFQNSRKRLDPSAVESDERYDRLKVDSIIDHYIEQYDYDDNYEMSERIASLQNFLEQLDYQDSRFSGSNLTPLQKVGDKFSGPPVQYFNTENKQRTKNNQRFPPQGSAFRMTDTINEATIGLFQASTEPSAKEVNNSSANTEKSDTNTQNSFKLSDPGNSTVSFTNTTNVNSTGELLQILRQVTPHLSHLFHQDKPEVVDSFPILNNDFQSGTFLNDELTDSSEVNFTSGSDSILEKISSIVKHENEKNNVVPDFRNEQVIALNQNEGNAIKQFGTNYQEELDRVSDKFKEELITSLNETKHNNTTDQLQETFENIFGNYDDISDLYDSDTIFETVPIAVEQIIKQNNSSSGNFNITDLNQNAEDAGTFALEPLKETEMLSDGETITRDGSKQPIVTDIQNPISNLPVVVGSSEPYRSRKFDHLCMDPFVVFTCGSCGSLVMCLYGEAFVYNCKYPMMSCHKDPMYNGGVCKMDPDPGCKCDSGEVVKPDPYDYSSYILCDVEPKEFRCEPYEEFNIELNRCVTMPIGPPCTSLGIFPNVKDCRWYQICRWSSMLGNFHQTNVRCSKADYVYSVHYKKCILKEDLPFDDPCIDGIPIYDEQVQVDHFISDGADETVILADGDYIIGDENGTISDNNLTDSTGAGQGTIPANIFDDNDNFVPDLPIVDSVAGEVVESRLSTRNVKLTTSEPKQVETFKCSPAVFLIVYWFPSLADYACTSSE